jgi:NifU-like protein
MSDPVICRCYQVTRSEIVKAIQDGDLRTVEEVTDRTNAAGGCSSCYDDIREILFELQGGTQRLGRLSSLPDAQRRERVNGVLRDSIEPLYRINGVQIQLLEVKGPKVFARLAGRTVGTTLPSILTLKWIFVKEISDACGEKMQLVEVNMLDRGIAEE